MPNNSETEQPDQRSKLPSAFAYLSKLPSSRVLRFIPTVLIALLSAWLGAKYAVSEQRALHEEHAAALRGVIRFEAAQNLRTLEKSTVNLRGAEASLKAFLAGNATAPHIGPGYIGLATVGLRLHLESPNAYYIPHGLVAIYGLIYGRLARHEEIQRSLDAAVIGYATALTPADRRRSAAVLLVRIGQQLDVSEALIDPRLGLRGFMNCLDEFSSGAEYCEILRVNAPETDGNASLHNGRSQP